MQLSKVAKDELRKKIEEELKDVPERQRIQLDKDILEYLLFEEIILNKEKNIKVKLPVWSGEFLRKIDLSQVDFTNVSWDILSNDMVATFTCRPYSNDIMLDVKGKLEKLILSIDILKNKGYCVNFSGTNARINLDQSFEALEFNIVRVMDCNFSGLDLSNQDFTGIDLIHIEDSDISDTELYIPDNIELYGYRSNLANINLSNRTIDIYESIFDCGGQNLERCNLTNSGVKINLNGNWFANAKTNEELVDAMETKWVGCYVNGKKVFSSKEKNAVATEKKEEYEKMKAEKFNSVLGSIEEQKKPRAK